MQGRDSRQTLYGGVKILGTKIVASGSTPQNVKESNQCARKIPTEKDGSAFPPGWPVYFIPRHQISLTIWPSEGSASFTGSPRIRFCRPSLLASNALRDRQHLYMKYAG